MGSSAGVFDSTARSHHVLEEPISFIKQVCSRHFPSGKQTSLENSSSDGREAELGNSFKFAKA